RVAARAPGRGRLLPLLRLRRQLGPGRLHRASRRQWAQGAAADRRPVPEVLTAGNLDRPPCARYAERYVFALSAFVGAMRNVQAELANHVPGTPRAPRTGARGMSDLARLLSWVGEWAAGDGPLLLMTDYDGTLTPIVDDPADAILADDTREQLMR